MKNSVLLLLALVAFFGCKEPQKKEKQFKGYVVHEGEYTTFTDCATGKEYWLEDKTGAVIEQYKQLAKQPYQQVYFLLEADLLPPSTMGPASAFDNIMGVKKVVESAEKNTDSSCLPTTGNYIFDCSGNNPAWAVTFSKMYVKFESAHPKDTFVYFPLATPDVRDSAGVGRIFYYNINNENFQTLQIIVTEKHCQDAAGKVNRFTATALFGPYKYEGCARLKTTKNEETEPVYINNMPTGVPQQVK